MVQFFSSILHQPLFVSLQMSVTGPYGIEVATIHKYQGREKDTIIMSTVEDHISEFCDDSNLINVAISRAKKRFCLVTSGNEQERKGNIYELLEYIAYNKMSVTGE